MVRGVADHRPLAAHGGVLGQVDERRAAQDGWGLLLELRRRPWSSGRSGPARSSAPRRRGSSAPSGRRRRSSGSRRGRSTRPRSPTRARAGWTSKPLGLQRRVEPAQGRVHRGGAGGGADGGLGEATPAMATSRRSRRPGAGAPVEPGPRPLVVPPVAAVRRCGDREAVTALPHAQGGRRDPGAPGQVADGQTTRLSDDSSAESTPESTPGACVAGVRGVTMAE